MIDRKLLWLMIGIGSTAGSYLPVLFGAGLFSGWSIIGGMLGGFAGIFAAYKLSD